MEFLALRREMNRLFDDCLSWFDLAAPLMATWTST
jgi:hypothetical protein